MNRQRWVAILVMGGVAALCAPPMQSQSIFDKLKDKAKAKINQKEDQTTDAAVNAADPTASKPHSKTESAPSTTSTSAGSATPAASSAGSSAGATESGAAAPPDLAIKVYQNYDFVQGEKILFFDDFTSTQDGEFPSQWELSKGQAVVNQQQGYQALLLT
ncbi:MAG: hypothetical protein ACRD3K_01335, partial [Edaphobacter sp.]